MAHGVTVGLNIFHANTLRLTDSDFWYTVA